MITINDLISGCQQFIILLILNLIYHFMTLNTVSCVNCENDISFNPDDYRDIDRPSIKCGGCGAMTPLTEDGSSNAR
jgi:hypothetical protein